MSKLATFFLQCSRFRDWAADLHKYDAILRETEVLRVVGAWLIAGEYDRFK